MFSEFEFMCPLDGSEALVRSILTNKGERQAVVCEQHGPLVWVGMENVGDLNRNGVQGTYVETAVLADLKPGEFAQVATGPFAGVWAVRPPRPDANLVIVPTVYASAEATGALSVSLPFTGSWRGRLSGGVWYEAARLI